MIEQNVRVVQCRGERIWVRLGSRTGCTACDRGAGCGAGVFAQLIRRKPATVELARGNLQVEPGQMITLAFPEQVYLKLVWACYGWPLVAALAGAVAGHALAGAMQAGPGLLDLITLTVACLAAGSVLRAMKRRAHSAGFVRSLQTVVCYPSKNPNMCTRHLKSTE